MKTRWMTLCALFAALTAAGAQLTIPVGAVPVNLALLPLLVCAALLPRRYALWSAAVYLGLGAAGLPVFAGMHGGLGTLLGPTGGYLAGYAACAGITSILIEKEMHRLLAMAAGVAACYGIGTAWLMISSGLNLSQAVVMGVAPFLLGDILKIIAADYLSKRLYLVVHT